MNKTIETLENAKKIFVKHKWIKNGLATTADGKYTSPTSPEAKCFCAGGAVYKAYYKKPSNEAHSAFLFMDMASKYLTKDMTMQTPKYNDKAKYKKDVVKLFDKAIELAKEAVA